MKKVSLALLALSVTLIALPGSANAPAGRYTVSAGTVTDTKTGLVWEQVDPGTQDMWSNQKAYCASLSLNGTGWRLPTKKELLTLVDVSIASPGPTIDSTFTGTQQAYYWSSTPVAGSPSVAWIVGFANGHTDYDDMSTTDFVRCVR